MCPFNIKNYMKKIIIGLSGKEGSFSEEAALAYCQKENIKDYEFQYLVTVENVLSSVSAGTIDMGIFPIENSNGGLVYEAVYAMAKHNFTIKKFFEIDVRQNLMALPKINTAEISMIASHQQALRQCRMYLQRKWPGVDLKEWEDTAAAAKDLRDGKLPKNCAVIAAKQAAKMYDLEILEEGIQDLKFNFTTFLAVTK